MIGIKNPLAALNDDKVRQIRLIGKTKTQVELAKTFGVSRHTIKNVLRKTIWKHVTP